MLSKAELGHLALVYLPQSYTEIVYKNKKQARAQRLVVNETHSNEDFITGSGGGGVTAIQVCLKVNCLLRKLNGGQVLCGVKRAVSRGRAQKRLR